MDSYRGVYKLHDEEHAAVLEQVERLAPNFPAVRTLFAKIATAPTQEGEIDILLHFLRRSSRDYRHFDEDRGDFEFINHDIKDTRDVAYYYQSETSDKPYAGSLDEDGAVNQFNAKAYGRTLRDLYMHVIQLIAYRFYNIAPMPPEPKVIVPVSACDVDEVELYKAECKQAIDATNTATYARGLDGQWHQFH